MEVLFFIFTGCYGALTLILLSGWLKIPEVKPTASEKNEAPYFLSVIIPVRNESSHIADLLRDLDAQSYPPHCFEVIVADDGSTDNTLRIINDELAKISLNVRIICLKGSSVGKKRALQAGIAKARGEIIITTDGDCRMGSEWLHSMAVFFTQKAPFMVAGPVTFHNEQSIFEQLQTIEFASLIGTGAASLYFNLPNMCNGANMAFKKKAFEAVNGYEGSWHIPSGDDEFLMQKIAAKFPGSVYFLKSREAIVSTKACRTLPGFINQRKRWAGKWKLHKRVSVRILAIFIFIYHLSFIIAAFLSLQGSYGPVMFLGLSLFKIMLEFVFLNAVLRFMKKKINPFYFLLLQIIYPWYVVFFGLVSHDGKYEWKGRKLSNLKTAGLQDSTGNSVNL